MRNRLFLPESDGVVFFFDKMDKHAFWMDSVYLPLDIIFIRDNVILDIRENEPPLTQTPIIPTMSINIVVETNGGWCAAHGITKGVTVELKGI